IARAAIPAVRLEGHQDLVDLSAGQEVLEVTIHSGESSAMDLCAQATGVVCAEGSWVDEDAEPASAYAAEKAAELAQILLAMRHHRVRERLSLRPQAGVESNLEIRSHTAKRVNGGSGPDRGYRAMGFNEDALASG